MKKALLFDFDGVIIDSERIRYATYEKLFQQEFGVQIPHFDPFIIGRKQEVNLQMLLEASGVEADISTLVSKRNLLLQETFRDYNNIMPVPGLLPFLSQAKEKGYGLGIASSSTAQYILPIVEYLRIRNKFDAIITSEDIPGDRGKPHPDVYLLASQRMGIPPEKCLVFEDSLHGIAAAKAAGMYCVAVATSFRKEELEGKADDVIDDFTNVTINSFFEFHNL